MTRLDSSVGALSRARFARHGSSAGTYPRRGLPIAGAALIAVVVAYGSTKSLIVPLLLLGGIVGFVLLGPEVCICLCVLASLGLMPFLDSVDVGPSRLPYWLISFGLAAMIMLGGFAARSLSRARLAPTQPGLLLWLLLLFAAYTLLQMEQSDPMSAPSIATPFIAFPSPGW